MPQCRGQRAAVARKRAQRIMRAIGVVTVHFRESRLQKYTIVDIFPIINYVLSAQKHSCKRKTAQIEDTLQVNIHEPECAQPPTDFWAHHTVQKYSFQ